MIELWVGFAATWSKDRKLRFRRFNVPPSLLFGYGFAHRSCLWGFRCCGSTTMDHLILLQSFIVCQVLLKNGADINGKELITDFTPLMRAVFANQLHAVQVMHSLYIMLLLTKQNILVSASTRSRFSDQRFKRVHRFTFRCKKQLSRHSKSKTPKNFSVKQKHVGTHQCWSRRWERDPFWVNRWIRSS